MKNILLFVLFFMTMFSSYSQNIDSIINRIDFNEPLYINIIEEIEVFTRPVLYYRISEFYKIETFADGEAEIIDAIDTDIISTYFKIKSKKSGQIGYIDSDDVEEFYQIRNDTIFTINAPRSIDSKINFYNKLESKLVQKSVLNSKVKKGLDIKSIGIDNINSATGVECSITWGYFNSEKTIKYIHFTVIPFNSVGDVQTCDITDESSQKLQITGPIKNMDDFKISSWGVLWYNSSIRCIKISKVEVEYMDGTKYTYVNELYKLIDKNDNNCSFN